MNDSLRNEDLYELERGNELIWRLARQHRISRRSALKLAAASVGTAWGSGLLRGFPRAAADPARIVKPTPPELFYDFGSNAETRFEAMKGRGYLTPNSLFFVRNTTATPAIDAATWRLVVDGDGVKRPLSLTYDELVAMPSRTVVKFIECAGNGRRLFDEQQGTPASGTQWHLGAVGVARWKGVPLAHILDLAGVTRNAVDVLGEGLDSQRVRRPIPIEKALDPETLVVYEMNGETLPLDHGFPARLLVPGWVGIANIKWLGHIGVSQQPISTPWNTTSYVMVGDAYPDGPPLSTHRVKSAFELPWGATLRRGRQTVTGRAWSAFDRIHRVEVSDDAGRKWKPASFTSENRAQAWVQWSARIKPRPGIDSLRARAIDRQGNVQPDSVPFNRDGYLFWAAAHHPVSVAAS